MTINDDENPIGTPAWELFSNLWGSVCVTCHSDLVDAMCPRCTGLATIHNAMPVTAVDWDAVRADTARVRQENDIRLFQQFVTGVVGHDVTDCTHQHLGAYGPNEGPGWVSEHDCTPVAWVGLDEGQLSDVADTLCHFCGCRMDRKCRAGCRLCPNCSCDHEALL